MTAIQSQPEHLATHIEQDSPLAPDIEMPDTRTVNYYEADPHLRFLLRRRLTAEELALAEPVLKALGARLGNEIEDLATEADRQTPVLVQRDKRGERVDEVVASRAYRAMEAIFYGELGLHALSLRPGVLDPQAPSSLALNDALIYLAEQVESGLFCPLSMTRALARTLQRFAPVEIVAEYLPWLLATDLESLLTGAMFMTEKQGGSDLGQTATVARPSSEREGWWELRGEKWFCSNVSAGLILTLARPEGAGPGTRGLGLFLVPRDLPGGARNHYRIERLKDKLGIRSFASGEVTFDGTLALLIGGPGRGWLQMTEMLNVTRLGCASAAAALARRSFLEALVHARGRHAFGRTLADLPLMREQLLDMLLDVEGMTALFFEGSAQLAAADAGDEQARLRARVLTPLAKFFVSEEARRVVAEGMEVRGGNAYIEDWPNARLLRDVQVQAIWEGTGNISALDVGRALLKDQAGEALLADLRLRLAAIGDTQVCRSARLVGQALDEVETALRWLAASPADEAQLLMKRLTRQLARAVTAALLVEEAGALADEGGGYRSLAQAARYLRRNVFPPAGSPANETDRLPLDHFDAIVDWTPALPAAAVEPLLSALESALA
ncbi:MAG TPA: acyl-CoA dehydrogenase family protein [Ktedonobacterales bacterium]|nr:acyl-CoA dehydrogenase family protein [Ktedonobacterales bacterium]